MKLYLALAKFLRLYNENLQLCLLGYQSIDEQDPDPVYNMLKGAIEVRRSTDPETCIAPMSLNEKNWSSNFLRNQLDYGLKPQFVPRPKLRSNPSSSSGGSSVAANLLAVNQPQLASCSGRIALDSPSRAHLAVVDLCYAIRLLNLLSTSTLMIYLYDLRYYQPYYLQYSFGIICSE